MSTKIYDGFAIADDVDLFDLSEQAREVLDPIRDELDFGACAEVAISNLVQRMFGVDENAPLRDGESLLLSGYFGWRQRMLDEDPKYTWHDPHRFSFTVMRDPDTGKRYGIAHAARRRLIEAFMGLDGISEFGYWDNTDRPDHVTEDEWDLRRDTWDRMVPWGVPALRLGYTFTLRPENDINLYDLFYHHVNWSPGDVGYQRLEKAIDTHFRPVMKLHATSAVLTRLTHGDDSITIDVGNAFGAVVQVGDLLDQHLDALLDAAPVQVTADMLIAPTPPAFSDEDCADLRRLIDELAEEVRPAIEAHLAR